MSYSFNQAEKNSIRPITQAQRPGKGGTDFQSWALVHWCLRHRLQFILPGHLPHHNPLCAHSYYEKNHAAFHRIWYSFQRREGEDAFRLPASKDAVLPRTHEWQLWFWRLLSSHARVSAQETYRTLLEFDEPGSHVKIPVPSGIFTIRVCILSINFI